MQALGQAQGQGSSLPPLSIPDGLVIPYLLQHIDIILGKETGMWKLPEK